MLNTKNRIVSIGNTDMDYVSFRCGKQTLVMLPSLGETLQSRGICIDYIENKG